MEEDIIEYLIAFFVHIVLIGSNIFTFQHLLVKEENSSTVFVQDIYLVPLEHMKNICLIALWYISVHYGTLTLTGISLPEYVLIMILTYVKYSLYSSLLLTALYIYIENTTLLWNQFNNNLRKVSSAHRMILMIAMFTVFMYLALHFSFKNIPIKNILSIQNNDHINIFAMMCGLVLVSLLNGIQSTPQIDYVSKTIAFMLVLVLG